MPSRIWGTPLKISEYIVVGGNDEIPKGQKAYVFGTGNGNVARENWEKMLNGDLSEFKNKVEQQIPGTKCLYIALTWQSATYKILPGHGPVGFYDVQGFRIEAVVENVQANLTGLEIVAILMAVSFLIGVVGLLVTSGWVIWRVMKAAEDLGPGFTIGTGLAIAAGIGLLLLVMFGGRAEYRSKKRRFKIGKTRS